MSLFNCCSKSNYIVIYETSEYYYCQCSSCGEYFKKYK